MAIKFLSLLFKNTVNLLFLLTFTCLAAAEEGPNGGILSIYTKDQKVDVTVELADTPEARSEGLMFRENLPKGHGMLFDFKLGREVHFWMKNTFIPLDMYFIQPDGEIIHIHKNAKPQDETIISSPAPVRWVLEVAAGSLQEFRIEEGQKVVYKAAKK